MENFFDKGLHYIGKNQTNVFVLNIGAMDGVMFDEMIGYTNTYNFKGLYVEPIPYLFEKLKNNIKGENNIFENVAISTYDGEIEMIMIKQEAIDDKKVHSCFYGMSAVYPPKNGLGSEFDKLTVEKYGEIIKVKCVTFETLMSRNNISEFDVIKIDAEGHDFKIFSQVNLEKYKPKIIRSEWICISEEEKKEFISILENFNYKYEIIGQDICALSNDFYNTLLLENKGIFIEDESKKHKGLDDITKTTIVTGLWDIKRDSLSNGWNRNFDHYLNNLKKLMKCQNNMIIYIEEKYRYFVESHRKSENTLIIIRELSWFKENSNFFDNIQKIRTNPDWYNQIDWLGESTQAKLEMYNPIVMSKIFLLNDAVILDKFNSEYLIWVDAGLTNTVHEGYFNHDKVIDKIHKYFNKFSFVCFPYDGKVEIHGFKYDEICRYSGGVVNKVARGGIFGGPKSSISTINNIYYTLLSDTLNNGLMGTEESIFTIMTYKYPELIQYYEIENNGLLGTFFENLKNEKLVPKVEKNFIINEHDKNNVALYVLTYNSPKQFEKLCISFEQYDNNFLLKPKKFLINNSLDRTTDNEYENLCLKYGFEEIKKDNIGICGGRQFVSEHSDENGFDYHIFFEDDMFFYLGNDMFCRNGFKRKVENLYDNIIDIVWKESFDFLKLNFSEFFGDNTKQWAWHNVPEKKRLEFFPENPYKTTNDLNASPFLNFKNIKSHNGLPYATGEIFYCNWPQIVSREGNKKMFLDVKWSYPYEQTWMSHIFQETMKGNIKPSILLATPTEHNRFDFYPSKERKEN